MKTILKIRIPEFDGVSRRAFDDMVIDVIMDKTGTRSAWDRPRDVGDAISRATKKLNAIQVNSWFDNASGEYVFVFLGEDERKPFWKFWA